MNATGTGFYVTGGTLPRDAPSYVERQADIDLYDGLSRGDFCYVLTSRQMGKSSLMVHTATRLQNEGFAVVLLDLTAIGRNLSPEQWYGGLLAQLGQHLDLEDDLDDFWVSHPQWGPLQRWMAALREVVLVRCPGRVVIFVDEIDVVRVLPFDTDEFFAGIRECYNRRTQGPAFARLSFCLLGVASPSDLIQDTRLTPFNIGRRIELTDFTESEAAPLAIGLAGKWGKDSTPASLEAQRSAEVRREGTEEAQMLLQRVLYWTGGHPYLTQRLCRAILERQDAPLAASSHVPSLRPSASSPRPLAKRALKLFPLPQHVDAMCDELFLSSRARERDDNLLFVRERMLRGDVDRAGLLDLYGTVWAKKPVSDDETNPLVSALHLSGIARAVDGKLQVRNRIYGRVFDRSWVTANMPDAELRRQRAAYRRGLLWAGLASAVIVVVIAALAISAFHTSSRAIRLAAARQQALTATRRLLYTAQTREAQQAWIDGDVPRALALLNAQKPTREEEDLRGFEWRYLWRQCQGDQKFRFRGHTEGVSAVAFSPDGRLLASAGYDKTVRLWGVLQGTNVATLRGYTEPVRAVAFSPDGKLLATAGGDSDQPGRSGEVKLWKVGGLPRQPRDLGKLPGHPQAVTAVVFSPDGSILATGSVDGVVRLWRVVESPSRVGGREVARFRAGENGVGFVAFSPDSKLLATESGTNGNNVLRLWDATSYQSLATIRLDQINARSISNKGDLLAASGNSRVELWDLAARRRVAVLRGRETGGAAAFSPDGRLLVTLGGRGSSVTAWDLKTWQALFTLRGQSNQNAVAFSPDGRTLATGGEDRTVALWDLAPKRACETIVGHRQRITSIAVSPDGKALASSSAPGDPPNRSSEVRLWDVVTRRPLIHLSDGFAAKEPGEFVNRLTFSPDGRRLAAAVAYSTRSGAVKLWHLSKRPRVTTVVRTPRFVRWVAFSPNGQLLASCDYSQMVQLWSVASGRSLARLNAGGEIREVEFSPDGRTLATATDPDYRTRLAPEIRLWDVAAGKGTLDRPLPSRGSGDLAPPNVGERARLILRGHRMGITGIAFSPDSRILASSAYDETVKLWDLTDGRAVATLIGHSNDVERVCFSPDGRTVASAGSDGLIHLWNVIARERAVTLRGSPGRVCRLAFSPDGNLLASAGDDGMIHLWRAAPFAETDAP